MGRGNFGRGRGAQQNVTSPLKPPRTDYLTHEQAQQLRVELLAGCEVPADIPRSVTHAIAIADTGCARSMGNHPDQFRPGTIHAAVSDVSGVGGTLQTKEKGELCFPMNTQQHGIRMWRESDSIVNTACAYVLLAVGKASRKCGVALHMPPWGEDCELTFPNGVIVKLLNGAKNVENS